MIAAVAATLAGCAESVPAMRELGALETVQFSVGHKAAAECAIQKFDETSGLINTLRVYDSHAEIVGGGPAPWAYVDFRPNEAGARADIYAANLITRGILSGRLAASLKECATQLDPHRALLAGG
jgi:hypothetical protein